MKYTVSSNICVYIIVINIEFHKVLNLLTQQTFKIYINIHIYFILEIISSLQYNFLLVATKAFRLCNIYCFHSHIRKLTKIDTCSNVAKATCLELTKDIFGAGK